MLYAEQVGPYTVGLAFIVMMGIPIMVHFTRRAVRLEAGPIKVQLDDLKKHTKTAADASVSNLESLGEANGAGSIQHQLADLRDRVVIDEAMRAAGEQRQRRIEEAVEKLQDQVVATRELMDRTVRWQVTHGEEDMRTFNELHEAVEALRALLGEPDTCSEHSHEPLIPYIHELAHAMRNQNAVKPLADSLTGKMLEEAVDLLKEVKAMNAENKEKS